MYSVEALTPSFDPVCRKLAEFLKTKLNESYSDALVVREAKDWDIIPSPQLCPLIKVYRQTDNYFPGTFKSESTGTIEYVLAYPQQETLPGITFWVSKQLNRLLLEYSLNERWCTHPNDSKFFTVNHGIMTQQSTQAIYPFVKAQFSFIDA